MISLKEYLNQNPIQKIGTWSVSLEENEVDCKIYGNKAYITIKNDTLSTFKYITSEENKGALYTIDADGNAKKPCVFILNFDLFANNKELGQ